MTMEQKAFMLVARALIAFVLGLAAPAFAAAPAAAPTAPRDDEAPRLLVLAAPRPAANVRHRVEFATASAIDGIEELFDEADNLGLELRDPVRIEVRLHQASKPVMALAVRRIQKWQTHDRVIEAEGMARRRLGRESVSVEGDLTHVLPSTRDDDGEAVRGRIERGLSRPLVRPRAPLRPNPVPEDVQIDELVGVQLAQIECFPRRHG
jgi:hypothetical protein